MNAMNFALFAQRRLAVGFKAFTCMLLGAPIAPSAPYRMAYDPLQRFRTGSTASSSPQKSTSLACSASLKPLRVLRVMEPGQQRTCVGRMVISGRMADVCAELDRLAAREAAIS